MVAVSITAKEENAGKKAATKKPVPRKKPTVKKKSATKKTAAKTTTTTTDKNNKPKKKKPGSVGTPEWYKKYPWVVEGSVREPTEEDRKQLKSCHGYVCTIKCVDTGKLRVINTQDAFQAKRTKEAQLAFMKNRRAEARKKKNKK